MLKVMLQDGMGAEIMEVKNINNIKDAQKYILELIKKDNPDEDFTYNEKNLNDRDIWNICKDYGFTGQTGIWMYRDPNENSCYEIHGYLTK